jgi:hypothetical protein
MRAPAIGFVIALALAPGVAFAQAEPPGGPPPPSGAGATPPPGAISRDQFIQQRAEAAGRVFDQIDTNHTGYITRAQLRAYVLARRAGAQPPKPSGGPPPQQ